MPTDTQRKSSKQRREIELARNMRAAEQAARELAALHWSDDNDIAPDVMPPDKWDQLSTGWVFNVYSRRIDVACSSTVHHAVGRTDKTTTQQPIRMYSTRERALRALRVALEHEFAAELAKIDALLSEL
jgi:hypothetical protein